MPDKLTKSMIAPSIRTLKLKLRPTDKEVLVQIKLLSLIEIAQLFHEAGIESLEEALWLCAHHALSVLPVLEGIASRALSVKERWSVEDVRNAFDLEELVKITDTVSLNLIGGSTIVGERNV